MIKVSIIVPMYNCEKTISALLDSIENQTFSDYEVILVDDGSKDNTVSRVEEIIGGRKQYQIIQQENKGAPSARNAGIKKASGEFIYLCDSDDYLELDALENLVCAAEKNQADLVVANSIHFQDGAPTCSREYKGLPKRSRILKQNKFFMCDPFPGTKLYKKKVINKYNIVFDDVKIAQDLNFYIKYLVVAKKAVYIDKVVYYYRKTAGSISRTYKVQNVLEIKKSIKYVKKFIVQNHLEKYLVNLEYVKMANYVWQLRKKNHFSECDYQILRKELCGDVNLKYFSFRNNFAYSMSVIELVFNKYLNICLRKI